MISHSTVHKQWHTQLVVVASILAVGVVLAVIVFALSQANGQSGAIATRNEPVGRRALEAEAARYTALAEFYLAKDEANSQRAIQADAARYNGLAEFYATNSNGLQRGIEASSARYTGLAKHYAAENDGLQRGIEASAARYTALADYYAAAAK
ncbi:MAG: hypothetical protein D6784_07785 [Chloroflexi bacterium]|nr:MAG: hypothetical protein D6784_07785 [Chloroflexota bacterium]